MQYIVKRQYARGSETSFAEFTDLNDAKLFIQAKLAEDSSLNVKVIYRITEFGDVLHEYDPSKMDSPVSSGSSQGKASTASFNPTPFNTAPRPTGMPQKWLKDEDENEKK